jgi:hypothetical protein
MSEDNYMSPDDLIDKYGYYGQRYGDNLPASWEFTMSERPEIDIYEAYPGLRPKPKANPFIVGAIVFAVCLILSAA